MFSRGLKKIYFPFVVNRMSYRIFSNPGITIGSVTGGIGIQCGTGTGSDIGIGSGAQSVIGHAENSKEFKQDYKVEASFKKLHIQCGGHFQFEVNDKMTILQSSIPFKCTLEQDVLKVEGENTGGGTIFCNGQSLVIQNGVVFVNGQRMVPANQAKETSNETSNEYSKRWSILGIPKICKLTISGSGNVNLIPEILQVSFHCNIQGSGQVNFPKNVTFKKVKANISGSGDIDFQGCNVHELDLDIAGSGDINNFIAKESVTANIAGSGDIKGYAIKGCDVDKNVAGSGDIKIRRI